MLDERTKKAVLRIRILEKLKAQKEETRHKKSLALMEKFFSLEEFKRAKNILLYAGKEYEVDTRPIIKEALKRGKRIFLPVTDAKGKRLIISEVSDLEKDTELGFFGIYEPKADRIKETDPKTLDLIVAPGIAFDRHNNRIGHGAGYYDRFLKDIPHNIPRISLAFDFQMLGEDIPSLPHDIAVTRVVTS